VEKVVSDMFLNTVIFKTLCQHEWQLARLVATKITPSQFLVVNSTFDKVYLYENQPERGKQCLVVCLCLNSCGI
jgi:hypothetical protein